MKYMLYEFITKNPTFGRQISTFSGTGKYTKSFITNYIPIDKNITVPQDTEEAKQFFTIIHEYMTNSNNMSGDDDDDDAESSYDDNQMNVVNNNNNMNVDDNVDNNDDNNMNVDDNDTINSEITLHIDIADSNVTGSIYENSDDELILTNLMTDLCDIKSDDGWDELINDTDSVS